MSGTFWHEPAVPMQIFFIPSVPSTEHTACCGQLLLSLSHVFILPNCKKAWRIQGVGRDLVGSWHSSVLGRICPGSQLYEGRPNARPCASVPRHSCGEESCRLSAPCWDFYVHISACTGGVLLCKPACLTRPEIP